MPNIPSAAKRIRSDAKKRAKNQAVISELKSMGKKLTQLAAEPEKAKAFAATLVSRYDRAVSSGVIPRGRADRKKSRIATFLAKIKK
ncbi:MAG TPA: 30S ribosomal protein S20 [Candidatus Omnitrophota bacterium]|nr:30S ribosomal protein S20 [Candidatus Omnitrophota bacterium]HPS37595.1 30S ribosomal protein S20 [Candidatus Omnitrophota bacterium]